MKRGVLIVTLQLMLVLPVPALSAEKEVIIGFKQQPGPSEKALIHGARGIVSRSYKLIPAMAARLPEEEIENLRHNANVAYVEESAVYQTPAGPLAAPEYETSWGILRSFADVAHESGNKGTGVRVAILDTGIDYTHEDLDGNYSGGHDYVFNDDDPFDDSFNGHGTHVAGIIGAENNGSGVIGMAPESELFAVKVLDGAGFGTEEWIIAGIEWAVANGMEIINMSLEGPDRQGLHDACDAARGAGLLLVAAAGNSLGGAGPVEYPGAYESVMAATATDASDLPASFAPVGDEIELAAPGVEVVSTATGGGYGTLSGTSQAAAHVTGAAALFVVSNTQDQTGDGIVNNEDVRRVLQLTATDLGDPGKDEIYGHGLLNAASASFAQEVDFTVTRTSGPPTGDAEVLYVVGLPHSISIANAGLAKLDVDVFAGAVLRRDLSRSLHFSSANPQEVTFELDGHGARYDVYFTPYGRPGTSAAIVVQRETE